MSESRMIGWGWYRVKAADSVEAFRYTGTVPVSFLKTDERLWNAGNGDGSAMIGGPHGMVHVYRGDWIVRESNGALSTCSPDGFAEHYEKA